MASSRLREPVTTGAMAPPSPQTVRGAAGRSVFLRGRPSHLRMRFEESVKLEGNAADVWKRASAIEDIPKYWHGTRSLEVVEKSEGLARAKITFAFGGSGEADISTDGSARRLTINYRSGPFTGKQTVAVSDLSLVAAWDVRFRGVYRFASRWNEKHFRSGTIHALERLVGGSGEGPARVASPRSRAPSHKEK